MFARGRRRGACQAAGIAVEVMIAMVLQGDGFAKRWSCKDGHVERDGQWSTFSIVFET
jgi:hypothetical protein